VDDREQIRELIERMNRAWLEGPMEDLPAALGACFHPAMVIRGGDLEVHGSGRDECVASYVDFLERATVDACNFEEPSIDVAGDTAVAVYGWEMTFEMEGQTHHEAGSDILALTREGGRWTIAWRAMLPAIAD
jgi:ketosteroid isomerase-like protein